MVFLVLLVEQEVILIERATDVCMYTDFSLIIDRGAPGASGIPGAPGFRGLPGNPVCFWKKKKANVDEPTILLLRVVLVKMDFLAPEADLANVCSHWH